MSPCLSSFRASLTYRLISKWITWNAFSSFRASYTCECSGGWSGPNCTDDINECMPRPCQNGATCVDLLDSYQCICPLGYQGNCWVTGSRLLSRWSFVTRYEWDNWRCCINKFYLWQNNLSLSGLMDVNVYHHSCQENLFIWEDLCCIVVITHDCHHGDLDSVPSEPFKECA